eukprot:TRINITY_DN4618_c0_g1_i3.p1 TRINITY_DN4618_c0_g1~~TRINITY_DN4618_c0_g1_i3.p1  ORF type:complete len:844 (-),score=156.06 TRINITY_DN4618_c0_g1_i3:1430-3961(-)
MSGSTSEPPVQARNFWKKIEQDGSSVSTASVSRTISGALVPPSKAISGLQAQLTESVASQPKPQALSKPVDFPEFSARKKFFEALSGGSKEEAQRHNPRVPRRRHSFSNKTGADDDDWSPFSLLLTKETATGPNRTPSLMALAPGVQRQAHGAASSAPVQPSSSSAHAARGPALASVRPHLPPHLPVPSTGPLASAPKPADSQEPSAFPASTSAATVDGQARRNLPSTPVRRSVPLLASTDDIDAALQAFEGPTRIEPPRELTVRTASPSMAVPQPSPNRGRPLPPTPPRPSPAAAAPPPIPVAAPTVATPDDAPVAVSAAADASAPEIAHSSAPSVNSVVLSVSTELSSLDSEILPVAGFEFRVAAPSSPHEPSEPASGSPPSAAGRLSTGEPMPSPRRSLTSSLSIGEARSPESIARRLSQTADTLVPPSPSLMSAVLGTAPASERPTRSLVDGARAAHRPFSADRAANLSQRYMLADADTELARPGSSGNLAPSADSVARANAFRRTLSRSWSKDEKDPTGLDPGSPKSSKGERRRSVSLADNSDEIASPQRSLSSGKGSAELGQALRGSPSGRRMRRRSSRSEIDVDKQASLRLAVLKELTATEKDYVLDLEVLVNVFVKPLSAVGFMKKEDVEQLFSNLEVLLALHQIFLQRFKSDDLPNLMIGKIFCKLAPQLRRYSSYCANQQQCMSTLNRLKRHNHEFLVFIKRALNQPTCKNLSLESFLIKPVQRICKYPLFFKEILRYTPEDHPDFNFLVSALESIQEQLNRVNEQKRLKDTEQKQLEILKTVDGAHDLFRNGSERQFLKDGFVDIVVTSGKDRKTSKVSLRNARPRGHTPPQ